MNNSEKEDNMKKEAITHGVLEDLANRNDNWDKLDGVPEKVDALETNKQETKVKISSVEKELNSLKSININSNQEATQVAQGYGVVSLPKTAGEGQVSSIGIKGLTYTNILGTHNTKNNLLTLLMGSNLFLSTDGGINTLDTTGKLIKLIANNRYLIKIDFLNPTTNNLNLLRAYNGSVIVSGTALGTLITNGLSSYIVFTAPSTDTVKLALRNNMADSNYYHDKSIIVDLTAIGETETDINKLIQKYPYVSNTKSTISASRLKSVDSEGNNENELYLPNVGELRSLPNGVADEIVNGELVKRVSDTMEELAEPIITPINVSGNLISYPSGTVYVENVVADAGLYTKKMDILNTDLPIKTLDKLSKVDYTTGLEHSLDVSKAVVTAQSFTHPDLTMGDIVFFEYYYDLESTNGNASVEYYDSRYTVKDSVTDKVYKWSITIANGVPSITTEEV